jgi:hypothetical protein
VAAFAKRCQARRWAELPQEQKHAAADAEVDAATLLGQTVHKGMTTRHIPQPVISQGPQGPDGHGYTFVDGDGSGYSVEGQRCILVPVVEGSCGGCSGGCVGCSGGGGEVAVPLHKGVSQTGFKGVYFNRHMQTKARQAFDDKPFFRTECTNCKKQLGYFERAEDSAACFAAHMFLLHDEVATSEFNNAQRCFRSKKIDRRRGEGVDTYSDGGKKQIDHQLPTRIERNTSTERAFWDTVHGQRGVLVADYLSNLPSVERATTHPFHLHNLPRLKGSLLAHAPPTPGVILPWSYVGSRFSAFCWHVEDNWYVQLHHVFFISLLTCVERFRLYLCSPTSTHVPCTTQASVSQLPPPRCAQALVRRAHRVSPGVRSSHAEAPPALAGRDERLEHDVGPA